MSPEEKREKNREYAQKKRLTDPEGARAYKREWSRRNVERIREYKRRQTDKDPHGERTRSLARQRKRRYGLTPEAFDALLLQQDSRCAICRSNEWGGQGVPCVDHCHTTGLVRGLLCHPCNVALGHLGDCAVGVIVRSKRFLAYLNGGAK